MFLSRFCCLRRFMALAAVLLASVAQAAITPPDQLVKQLTQETYAYVNQDAALQRGDTTRLVEWGEKNVFTNFDFSRMTSLAVGKDWRQATAEQKKLLTIEFRTLLIRTFANAFVGVKKEHTIEYKPFKMNPDDQSVVVKMLIIKPGAKPIDVNFNLEKSADTWKVFDIVLAGVSLITNYRDSFAQEIHANGMDGLIKMLSDKNKQLEKNGKSS